MCQEQGSNLHRISMLHYLGSNGPVSNPFDNPICCVYQFRHLDFLYFFVPPNPKPLLWCWGVGIAVSSDWLFVSRSEFCKDNAHILIHRIYFIFPLPIYRVLFFINFLIQLRKTSLNCRPYIDFISSLCSLGSLTSMLT